MPRFFVATAIFTLAAMFSLGATAQTPKQGTIFGTHSHSGMFRALAMGEEHVQVNYEHCGVIGAGPQSNFPTTAASVHCLGSS